MPEGPFRKRIQHFNEPGHAHLLTFSCYQRRSLLTRDDWRLMLSQAIDAVLDRGEYSLAAFVYMPEHVHLLVLPEQDKYDISTLIRAIKRPFSFRVKKSLESTGDPALLTLIVRERPGKMSFRFWQEGPGTDRNIACFGTLLKAAEYIHNNPVRRELCESPDQWEWSSWKYYHAPAQYDRNRLPRIQAPPG